MVSTMTSNGTAELTEESQVSTEPKLWSEAGNPFMLLNLELVPEAATSEGAVVQTKRGPVILDIDFVALKYGRDIQSLGLSANKDGWLELAENVWELHQQKAQKEADNALMQTARHLFKLNPNNSVEHYFKQLKAMTK